MSLKTRWLTRLICVRWERCSFVAPAGKLLHSLYAVLKCTKIRVTILTRCYDIHSSWVIYQLWLATVGLSIRCSQVSVSIIVAVKF